MDDETRIHEIREEISRLSDGRVQLHFRDDLGMVTGRVEARLLWADGRPVMERPVEADSRVAAAEQALSQYKLLTQTLDFPTDEPNRLEHDGEEDTPGL